MTSQTAKSITKTALVISVLMLAVWMMLGTGSTIAWFSDTSEVIENSFVIGEVSIEVSYKNDKTEDYTVVDPQTEVFDDEALYEPGYTQVVYFKVENTGDIAFDYRLGVKFDPAKVKLGFTENNEAIYLPDYLRYRVLFAESEEALEIELADRMTARGGMEEDGLNQPFNSFSEQRYDIQPEGIEYVAIIIYMPEYVGNEANYRSEQEPRIDLDVSVLASQAGSIKMIDDNGQPIA